MKLERIVVGVDFSPSSLEAALWASRHLVRDGVELVLAHMITIPEPPPILHGRFPRRDLVVETLRVGAEKRLRELSSSLPPGRIWLEIREGDVATGLSQLATTFSADMVVIGAHGERLGLAEGLGSTAERVVRTSPVPVLLVTKTGAAPPSRILVPVDDSPMAVDALRWAGTLSRHFDAHITALHVVPASVMSHVLSAAAAGSGSPLPGLGESFEEHNRWTETAARAGVQGERFTSEVAFGSPAQEIVSAAERLGGNLIVMGRRGAGKVRRTVLGSTVDAVLRHAPCPVLVVVKPHK